MNKIIEYYFKVKFWIIGFLGEAQLRFIEAIDWFVHTKIGGIVFEEWLNGFIVTPFSILCDVLWFVAALILLWKFKPKLVKWCAGFASFIIGCCITGFGAPQWISFAIPLIAIIVEVVIKYVLKKKAYNNH